jgi:hypothetical protein
MHKRNQSGIHVIAALAVLPFVVLAAYCHPYYDDYGTAILLKQTGFWTYFVDTYQHWSGRYAFLLANVGHPLRFGGLRAYQWGAAGLVAGLGGSCYVLAWGLTAGSQLPRPARLAWGSGLTVAIFALLPSPAEGFYWVLGGYNYTLPILVGFGGLAAGCGYAATAAPMHRRLLLLGMLWAAILFPGFSEFSACLTLLLAGGLLAAFPRAGRAYWVLAAVAIVGAVAMLAAPGNLGRLHQTAYEWHLLQDARQALGATAYTLLNWLAFPAFWLLAALAVPVVERMVAGEGPVARLTRRPVLWPLLLLLGMLGCYFFSYLTVHLPVPQRARNLLFAYFIVTLLLSMAGIVQLAQRRGWARPRVAPSVLLGLLVLALAGDGNGRLRSEAIGRGYNTVGLAYRDWLSGDAARFDAAQRHRYALLRTAAADSVGVPPLPVMPATLSYYDIGPSSRFWGNQVLALYFGKKAVWVQPNAPAK